VAEAGVHQARRIAPHGHDEVAGAQGWIDPPQRHRGHRLGHGHHGQVGAGVAAAHLAHHGLAVRLHHVHLAGVADGRRGSHHHAGLPQHAGGQAAPAGAQAHHAGGEPFDGIGQAGVGQGFGVGCEGLIHGFPWVVEQACIVGPRAGLRITPSGSQRLPDRAGPASRPWRPR
jgi:hypothetical protein